MRLFFASVYLLHPLQKNSFEKQKYLLSIQEQMAMLKCKMQVFICEGPNEIGK